MHPRLNNTLVQAGYESDSQAWQHTLKSEVPVQFLHLQKLRIGASGALTALCWHKCCAVKTHSVLETCRVQERKNDASVQRMKNTWHCMVLAEAKIIIRIQRETSNRASFTPLSTCPRKRAALAGHRRETSEEDCAQKGQNKGTFFVWTMKTSL